MDQRVEGAGTRALGRVQETVGRATGDIGTEVKGRLNDAKGAAIETYGRALDSLTDLVDRAPADLQDPARRGLDFARRKPLVTTGIIAGVLALLLGAAGRSATRR